MKTDGELPAELSKLEKGYELLGELSRDAMLTMYVARDRLSGNEVAIKVLRARDARDREALAHYASDARLLTALEHPNIVAVHSVKWLSEDVVAVVTERVRGPSLRQVLDVAGTLPVSRATDVLRGLGRALTWAHSSQIMHRDVRPETVTFEDGTGRVVLSDFGLARRLEVAPGASDPGADTYRAPELSDGRYPDRRTDVFSLGIVGWELLTGRRPWPDTMDPIELGARAPAPPPLAEVRPGLPPALVAALEGAVELDRDRRITDIETFMERLTKVAPPAPEPEEEPVEEIPLSVGPTEWVALPVPRMPRRRRTSGSEREVQRETAREIGDEAAEVAASSEQAATAESSMESSVELPVERSVERSVEREVEREVEHGAPPVPADSIASAPPREAQPTTGASAEAASAEAASLPQVQASTVLPPDVTADAKRRRPKKGGVFRDASADATGEAVAPPSTEQTRPEAARVEPARQDPVQAEPPRVEPARVEPARPRDEAAATLLTWAAALRSMAAASTGGDTTRAKPAVSQAPLATPREAKPPTAVPSDVELPPPEPVRFADLPHEPERAPIPGPVRGRARGAARFEQMRGGLGAPKPPKERSRKREAASGPPAPPPLQPMWDTPAEFPLPVMPDPRPMPADAGAGAGGATRRRLTRRGIGIAAAVVLVAAAAIALARMQRAPDTTAELMQPENPTGYGGDVVLTPRAGDSTILTAPATGRAGGAATRAGGATRSRDVPAPAETLPTNAPRAATQPTTSAPAATRPTTPAPEATRPTDPRAATRPDAAPPTGRRSPPARQPATPAGSSTPETRGVTSAAQPSAVAPAVTPAPTATRPAGNGPCSSPALADQRACLSAAIDRSDAGLNQTYGEVIAAMRQRANTAPGDPDPPEVQRLRAAQRSWLARRDAECRSRGRGREGPLWATPRAQCLGEFSATRGRELSATLARLRRD